MLMADNLTKVYHSGFFTKSTLKAVDRVSFEIPRGECFGIIGESGSGKTTIGKMVLGLVNPTEGNVLIDGKNIYREKYVKSLNFRREVQMIFQEPDGVFDPRWKIGKSMMEPFNIHTKMSRNEKTERIEHWLKIVGLSNEHLDRYPFELSGGQLQRLAFARALALNPKLIVADEPTSSLDVSVQAQILTLMREIQEKYELTILYITHDLYVARQMCKSIAVMKKGEFVEMGNAEEVFRNPQHEYTKNLLEAQLPPDMSSRKKIMK